MNLADFGKLVASLRKEHEDETGAPWTQRRLAQECNLAGGSPVFTENIISSIERGKKDPDKDVLLALAGALQLTSSERRGFFLAASGVEAADLARKDNHPARILSQVKDRIRELYVPATVIDAYCNVLAVNGVLLELLEFPSAYGITPGVRYEPPYGYNLVHFVFSDDGSRHFQRLMGDGFSDFAFLAMTMFRTFSLERRSTRYFQSLFTELRRSRLFRRYWSEIYFSENERQLDNADIRARSPKWGDLSAFIAMRTAYTIAGDLHLAVFVPADQNTSEACQKILARSPSPAVFTLTPWPDRTMR